VTASFGLSAMAQGETDLDETLRRADQALYQAKSAGRNCCVAKVVAETAVAPRPHLALVPSWLTPGPHLLGAAPE
jgi:predicted signal transduction protein with EAL and GGDEF domain